MWKKIGDMQRLEFDQKKIPSFGKKLKFMNNSISYGKLVQNAISNIPFIFYVKKNKRVKTNSTIPNL